MTGSPFSRVAMPSHSAAAVKTIAPRGRPPAAVSFQISDGHAGLRSGSSELTYTGVIAGRDGAGMAAKKYLGISSRSGVHSGGAVVSGRVSRTSARPVD